MSLYQKQKCIHIFAKKNFSLYIIDYFIDIRILFVLFSVIIIEALYDKEVRP